MRSTLLCLIVVGCCSLAFAEPREFFQKHCFECHGPSVKEGDLDLSTLPVAIDDAQLFARWVKVHDRLASGEMPPRDHEQPPPEERKRTLDSLRTSLEAAEQARLPADSRTSVRRLTRAEYENTMRDLFQLPGISLQGDLPADGSAHGFDNNADALDISHVNMAKYVEAADATLDMAIAVQPLPPVVKTQRISLANPPGFVAHVLLHGDGVLLKNKQPDPDFPPAGKYQHLDQGAHERLGSFRNGASVGLFRHEDESFHPYFNEFVAIYPAKYRLRTSLWSFQWDKGQVLPARGTEAVRLSIVQLTGDGRGGGHPSSLLTYLDAPSINEQVHEIVTWLNPKETIGFNAASLVPGQNTRGKDRALGFTGPGIACDYLDVEGPLFDSWPPPSHKLLFGDLKFVEFKPTEQPNVRPPRHVPFRQTMHMGKNRPEPEVKELWTVHSDDPSADADRLLGQFLAKAFRRPVPDDVRGQYVELVKQRLAAGDCFELAMRGAYRAALCSPDFLYHVEPPGKLDDYALAARLSYFFWNSLPDDELQRLAAQGHLHEPEVLRNQVDRLLKDEKAKRFNNDFLGQWLKLRQIAANDADRKLYPEFSMYLQDSMVLETQAYFRELMARNLPVSYLVKSDFAMLNEKLAKHYGIDGVTGTQIRSVSLPADCPRGSFLAQASLLKITANGTTTSPVPRGAFVMARFLGKPPEPPPANVAAVEPDVRGATTIREQLEKHRNHAVCASCHAKIDPPGFALESFDVIGGFRQRYRSIGEGDAPERGNIDPGIGLGFRLGKPVDPSGEMADGHRFENFPEFQSILVSQPRVLLENLAQQLSVYATGRPLAFSDRRHLAQLVDKTEQAGGGVRTLIHELVQSPLFLTR